MFFHVIIFSLVNLFLIDCSEIPCVILAKYPRWLSEKYGTYVEQMNTSWSSDMYNGKDPLLYAQPDEPLPDKRLEIYRDLFASDILSTSKFYRDMHRINREATYERIKHYEELVDEEELETLPLIEKELIRGKYCLRVSSACI